MSLGHVKAVDKIINETGVNIYNLGTGNGYSVLQVVNAFEKASGQKVNYKIVDRRPGDIAECFADASKALLELGWKAQYGIDEMCTDSWNFAKNNKK